MSFVIGAHWSKTNFYFPKTAYFKNNNVVLTSMGLNYIERKDVDVRKLEFNVAQCALKRGRHGDSCRFAPCSLD